MGDLLGRTRLLRVYISLYRQVHKFSQIHYQTLILVYRRDLKKLRETGHLGFELAFALLLNF